MNARIRTDISQYSSERNSRDIESPEKYYAKRSMSAALIVRYGIRSIERYHPWKTAIRQDYRKGRATMPICSSRFETCIGPGSKGYKRFRHLESDFGMKLMTAKTPFEAASICDEWMAKHVEIIAHEQKTFTNAWGFD